MDDDEFLGLAYELDEQIKTYNMDIQAKSEANKMKDDIQPVWRNFSQNKNSTGGFYIWDVVQFMGNGEKPSAYSIKDFLECADGTWIMHNCYHFWTEEKAREFLKDNIWASWQKLIVVEKSIPVVNTIDTELDEEEPSNYMIG